VVLHDGRVLYTRWDYVDRNAVFYQQLWSTRPDGSDVRIFYGNNTYNPVGIWESRPVPGSNRVMATAAAHHAMTAGSIVLLDVTRGIDGLNPIARLTPDAMFPESEVPVINRQSGTWYSPITLSKAPELPPEAIRWPGHCYRTPCPLSEKYFFAAYSFDPLIAEPDPNWPAMFGLYLVDCFGNKELIYRDAEISSLWPVPLRPREKPPALPSLLEPTERKEGVFVVRDVHQAWPPLPQGSVKRLRIVQVLPKTTWHANDPSVGVANASPGKQVLGTVPVEADGSAYFRAPAAVPLAFQALDASGQAVQVMRSVAYLQPGEKVSCVGCHESRVTAPAQGRVPAALARAPSAIEPGPDGSNPLSYPILVQPVLDKHCVSCHNPKKPDGKVLLTGEPEGHYTVSYNALIGRVSFSSWAGKPGDFRQVNSEPLTQPGFFGARGSPLMTLLRKGHYNVALSPADFERLATWMDANALFYGTFDPTDQALQRRGERIAGPKLE
jgi:mono/diheme cytochrome c family protein